MAQIHYLAEKKKLDVYFLLIFYLNKELLFIPRVYKSHRKILHANKTMPPPFFLAIIVFKYYIPKWENPT